MPIRPRCNPIQSQGPISFCHFANIATSIFFSFACNPIFRFVLWFPVYSGFPGNGKTSFFMYHCLPRFDTPCIMAITWFLRSLQSQKSREQSSKGRRINSPFRRKWKLLPLCFPRLLFLSESLFAWKLMRRSGKFAKVGVSGLFHWYHLFGGLCLIKFSPEPWSFRQKFS